MKDLNKLDRHDDEPKPKGAIHSFLEVSPPNPDGTPGPVILGYIREAEVDVRGFRERFIADERSDV